MPRDYVYYSLPNKPDLMHPKSMKDDCLEDVSKIYSRDSLGKVEDI